MVFFSSVSVLLVACQSRFQLLELWQANRAEAVKQFPTFETGLNPSMRYLVAHVSDGPLALLALSHQHVPTQGLLETWVGANHQVVQTMNVVPHATHGLSKDLLPQKLSQPVPVSVEWQQVPAQARPALPSQAVSWGQLGWYKTPDAVPSYFAVALHRGAVQPVYAYRCWSPDVCLHTYRWPIDYTLPAS